MVIPKPLGVVNLSFAELRNEGEVVKNTQAFPVAIDQCTRWVEVRVGRQDFLIERGLFGNRKIIVADNGPAFQREKLRK